MNAGLRNRNINKGRIFSHKLLSILVVLTYLFLIVSVVFYAPHPSRKRSITPPHYKKYNLPKSLMPKLPPHSLHGRYGLLLTVLAPV